MLLKNFLTKKSVISNPPNVSIPKHTLFCNVTGYTDMAHFLYRLNFRNNTKYLHNIDKIKKDVEDYFYTNMYSFVHVGYKTIGEITIRDHILIDPNVNKSHFTLNYDNVIVHVNITWL